MLPGGSPFRRLEAHTKILLVYPTPIDNDHRRQVAPWIIVDLIVTNAANVDRARLIRSKHTARRRRNLNLRPGCTAIVSPKESGMAPTSREPVKLYPPFQLADEGGEDDISTRVVKGLI